MLRRSDDVARGGIFEVGEFLVTSEDNFLRKGVGCDTVGGGSGPYKSVKCFESLEVGKESTVKSYKDYVLFRNLCFRLAQPFSPHCAYMMKSLNPRLYLKEDIGS